MKYTQFSIRIPAELVKALDTEAAGRFRNRNQLIIDIFTERYHAPPTIQVKSPSRSRALARNGRKSKALIS